MKGDFSRDTFDATKHFSRVLMQQGRVQLDADWNEQTSILLHYLRTLAKDILGPHAGPADDKEGGFKIELDGNDLKISKGHYYVDGILCENDSDNLIFTNQKNYPGAKMPENPGANSNYLVYLDVWERHITALEDDSIREKALGGADTATRAEVVWQVKISDSEIHSCESANKFLSKNEKGKLIVSIDQSPLEKNPCSLPPESKYRGLENHLYRVEIHQGGSAGTATFKWSRENGSVVTSDVKRLDKRVKVSNSQIFSEGDWVELISNEQELRREPGVLVKVKSIDNDDLLFEVPVDAPSGLPDDEKESWPKKARRWNHKEIKEFSVDENGIKIVTEQDIPLENGVQVKFEGGSYTSGDYWLIPARVDTGIEWPKVQADTPLPLEPHGVTHHYAPLAILTKDAQSWTVNNDCRQCIKSVSGYCITATVVQPRDQT